MLDNDNLTYTYQKPGPNFPPKLMLITQERSQKLDLLIHLLTNLHQSLVICGPEGIGKTTLLQQLKKNSPDCWHFCHLIGSSASSFEGITQQLIHSLEGDQGPHLNLSTLREFCDQKKVILIIDDADPLLPGLMGELIRYAESFRGLRLVLAMSYNAYQLKKNADEALNDCHLIELPPLNRKQCVNFLQNFAAHSDSQFTLNNLTNSRIDELYRITHGIPGKLEFEINKPQPAHAKPWGIWLVFFGALSLSAYVVLSLFFEKHPADKQTLSSNPDQQPANEIIGPVPKSLDIKLGNTELNSQFINESNSSNTWITPSPSIAEPATDNSQVPTSIQTPTTSPPGPIYSNLAQTSSPLSPSTSVKTVDEKASDQALSPKPESLPQALTKKTKQISDTATNKTNTPPNNENTHNSNPNTMGTSITEDDTRWIKEQPSERYTLQVVTLSTLKAVQRFMVKYKDYADIKYFVVNPGDQAKFIVIYGSFESASEAKRHKEDMPEEFKLALEKRFSTLQKNRR
jgi:DamX protein